MVAATFWRRYRGAHAERLCLIRALRAPRVSPGEIAGVLDAGPGGARWRTWPTVSWPASRAATARAVLENQLSILRGAVGSGYGPGPHQPVTLIWA